MLVKVLFFGPLRDIVRQSEDLLELASSVSLGEIFDRYAKRHPRLLELRRGIVFARNHEFSPADTPVGDGDEVAFLPPVSGGSGLWTHEIEDGDGNFFGLTRLPVDTAQLRARIVEGTDGAVVDFTGIVRNNSKGRRTRYLDYECYEPMAIRVMADIGHSIASTFDTGRIAMVHRLGRMEIGETSVAIVVAAPHRKPAFEAALEGINRLKKLVPIWKKEHFEDGETWVDGEWDETLVAR